MCNINIWIKRKGFFPRIETILPVIQHVTGYSYVNNSDGEGAYFSKSKRLKKGLSKIDYGAYASDIEQSRTIITHQRISTSGFSKKYTQPFMNKDFILAHNGVLSSFVKGKKSDTFVLFETMTKFFKQSKVRSREQRIVNSVKKSLDEKNGSYSILLYDRITGLSYYFKSDGTSINFLIGNYLFISTANVGTLLPDQFKEIKIQPYTVYRIDYDLDVIEVGSIEKPTTATYSNYGGWYYNRKNGQRKLVEQVNVKDDTATTKSDDNNVETDEFFDGFDDYCGQCGYKLTGNGKYKSMGIYYCANCRPGGC